VTEHGHCGHEITEILELIASTAGCEVMPPSDTPFHIEVGELDHDDLRELRRLSGGLRLHFDTAYAWEVLPTPLPAGPVLIGERAAAQTREEAPDDLTNSCYIVAIEAPATTTGFHVVIDLDTARLGRCYLTSWDTFGLVGEMPVVATGVANLLRWLLELQGCNPAEHTRGLGDAYHE
jgi:hypothetical protein